MTTASVSLYCCPMPITKISWDLRVTDAEPMVATITIPPCWPTKVGQSTHQQVVTIDPVTIPPTYVKRQGLLRWQVDACLGLGRNYEGWVLVVELPVEPVVFRLSAFTMVALAIDAPTTLTSPYGRRWRGHVTFPDCKTNLFTMTAEAVTAVGVLTEVEV